MVILSCLISVPIAWWFMNKWSQDFAYRIDIHFSMFMISVLIILLTVMATICFQIIKAATANPIKILRTE